MSLIVPSVLCSLTDTVTGGVFVFPVNPDSFKIKMDRNYHRVQILNWAEIGRFGNNNLETITFSSYFPKIYDESVCNYYPIPSPGECVHIMRTWERGKVPLWCAITGMFYAYVALTSFEFSEDAGHPGDFFYSITLEQYAFTNASVFDFGPPPRPPAPSAPQPGTQYEIVSGDTLWGIARRYYGDGSLWPVIWEVNAPMTSGNPNLIFPGEVITIPAR